MVGLRALVAGTCLAALGAARAQISQETTLESYFTSSRVHQGLYHYLSWGETNVRLSPNVKATVSGLSLGGHNSYDEACVTLEDKGRILRLGRFKTAFGFSTWSDQFYNGFNHIPLERIAPLNATLGLTRDDTGAELTFGGPDLQVQTALVDVSPEPTQIVPKRPDHASLRLQTNRGDLILGGDFLADLAHGAEVYGLDARWTAPRLVMRGELMAGTGSSAAAWGYYIDAMYRIPKLSRTQAVFRTEGLQYGQDNDATPNEPITLLHTVGIRQVVSPNLAVNLNYGWGSGADNRYVTGNGLIGWTLRMMFQLHF